MMHSLWNSTYTTMQLFLQKCVELTGILYNQRVMNNLWYKNKV